jgi:membrane-associated phospholipid phosphatase
VARSRRTTIRAREGVKRARHPVLAAIADLDQAAFRLIRTRLHGPRADALMKALGTSGEWAAIWALSGLAAGALDGSRRGRWLASAAIGPAAIGVNFLVKRGIGRERPLLEEHPPLARAPTKLSFPSAHATSSLAAATAMARVAPGARPALYALAAAICASRPYLGMHYPSDVLAGAAFGTLLGRALPGLDGRPPWLAPRPAPPAARPAAAPTS